MGYPATLLPQLRVPLPFSMRRAGLPRTEVRAQGLDRQISFYAYWAHGMSTATLMRRAVVTARFTASMVNTMSCGLAVMTPRNDKVALVRDFDGV